jgi:hypothetical protein
MISAQELRIGNFVMVNGEIEEIFGICEDYPFLKTAKYGACVIEYRDLDPITLTEEWLLKHGFFVENFDYSIPISECKVVWLTLIPQDEECTAYSVCVTQTDEDEDDQNVFLSDISYVHQVQNLIFALTQEELKLN